MFSFDCYRRNIYEYIFSSCECLVVGCNEIGQVQAHVFTGLSEEEEEERTMMNKELHERYKTHGSAGQGTPGSTSGPVFYEDKCCGVKGCFSMFDNPKVNGDEHHYTSRINDKIVVPKGDSGRLAKAANLRADILACFTDKTMGIYIDSEEIIASLEKVKAMYLKPAAGGLWSRDVDQALQNLKPHITNCLQLPAGMKATIADRNGKVVLKRGTNTIESVWRCAYCLFLPSDRFLFVTYIAHISFKF